MGVLNSNIVSWYACPTHESIKSKMCDGFDHDNIDMDFEMYKQRTEAKLNNV